MVRPMPIAVTDDPNTSVRPLTRAAFDSLVSDGHFADERVELLEGVLVRMPPMSDRHARAIALLTRWFVRGLPDQFEVGPQLPIAASDLSEPEPDISVTLPRRVGAGHPRTAALVIEVTLTTQRTDLGIKPRIYAGADIPIYWVVDLATDRVVVHTQPVEGMYTVVDEVTEPAVLGFEGVAIPVAELLGR